MTTENAEIKYSTNNDVQIHMSKQMDPMAIVSATVNPQLATPAVPLAPKQTQMLSVPIFTSPDAFSGSKKGSGVRSIIILGDNDTNTDHENNINSANTSTIPIPGDVGNSSSGNGSHYRHYSIEEEHHFDLSIKFSILAVLTALPLLIFTLKAYDRIVLIIAFALVIINLVCFAIFYYTIFSATKLYRLRSNIVRLKGFSKVSVTNGIVEYPTCALTSISELVAIQGSFWHIASVINCFVSYFCVLIVVCIKWDDINNLYNDDNKGGGAVAGYLSLAGPYGSAIVAAFPLHTQSIIHVCMHYSGFVVMTLGVFGFGLQTHWSGLAICCILLYFGSVIGWLVVSEGYIKCLPIESKNSKKLHTTAIVCLIIEHNALIATTCAVIGYIVTIDELLHPDAWRGLGN